MKKIIAFVVFVGGLFANELVIEKQKEFEVIQKPDLLSSHFSLSVEDEDQRVIERVFEKAIELGNGSEICQGGQYSINPHYKNKTYQGYINFQCRFDDEKLYEKLLESIKKIGGKLSQGRINRINEKDSINEAMEKLEIEALNYPKTYQAFLHKNMEGYLCEVKKISFHNSFPNHTPLLMRASSEALGTKVTPPIKEDLRYTLSVQYLFGCEKKTQSTKR